MKGYTVEPVHCDEEGCTRMRALVHNKSGSQLDKGCTVHCQAPEIGVRETYGIMVDAITSYCAEADDICICQQWPIRTRGADGKWQAGKRSRIDFVMVNGQGDMLAIEVNGSKEHVHDPVVRKRDSRKLEAWNMLDNAFDLFVVPGRRVRTVEMRRDVWLSSFQADLEAKVLQFCELAHR